MQPENLIQYARAALALPAHKNEAEALVIKEGPTWHTMLKATHFGRPYGFIRLWGVIETRLINTLTNIARSYLENTEADLNQLLEERINALASWLNMTLSE